MRKQQMGFAPKENQGREKELEEEAAVWWEQTEKMLIPMQKAKRYLDNEEREAVATYHLLAGDRRAWEQWIEAKRFRG